MYAESDGYMDNAIPGVNRSNGKDQNGYRIKLLWTPNDDIELLFSHYHADLTTDDNGTGYEGQVKDTRGESAYVSTYDDYEVFKAVPSYSDTTVNEYNFNLQWSLDAVNLSLLGQYQDLNIFQQQDNSDFRVVPPSDVLRDYLQFDPVAYSIEFRADGELGNDIDYLFGTIYSDDQTNTTNFISQINIDGSAHTKGSGIYTNWTYRINDKWDTSLGARYSNVDYDSTVFGTIPGLGELNTAQSQNFNGPTYSYKLRYYPCPNC